MAKAHARSSSPEAQQSPLLKKKLKLGSNAGQSSALADDPTPNFASDLFQPSTLHRLNAAYSKGTPFKHALVEKLFQDDLLVKVKDECLSELAFTLKETDIYRVRSYVLPSDH
jgi:prolyl 3-hydroxylase /prolyl 3,4-dihydroxylase